MPIRITYNEKEKKKTDLWELFVWIRTNRRRSCVVEIDESHVSSAAKYHRGQQLRRTHHWVLDSVDCCSNKCFIHCLGKGEKRDRETLEPINIKPGTTMSLWKIHCPPLISKMKFVMFYQIWARPLLFI